MNSPVIDVDCHEQRLLYSLPAGGILTFQLSSDFDLPVGKHTYSMECCYMSLKCFIMLVCASKYSLGKTSLKPQLDIHTAMLILLHDLFLFVSAHV